MKDLNDTKTVDIEQLISDTNPIDSVLVFTYGTLQTGRINHYIMQSAGGKLENVGYIDGWEQEFITLAGPTDKVYHTYKGPQAYRVWGEVYRVPSEGMKSIDRLEVGYIKMDVIVYCPLNDTEIKCIAYAM